MMVRSVPVVAAPPSVAEIAPAPLMVIALLTDSVLDHVQVPAGTTTTSPSIAELTAALTSAKLQVAALRVPALAAAAPAKTRKTPNLILLITGTSVFALT